MGAAAETAEVELCSDLCTNTDGWRNSDEFGRVLAGRLVSAALPEEAKAEATREVMKVARVEGFVAETAATAAEVRAKATAGEAARAMVREAAEKAPATDTVTDRVTVAHMIVTGEAAAEMKNLEEVLAATWAVVEVHAEVHAATGELVEVHAAMGEVVEVHAATGKAAAREGNSEAKKATGVTDENSASSSQ